MDKGKVNEENKMQSQKQLHHYGFTDEEVCNLKGKTDKETGRSPLAGSCPPIVLPPS